MNVLSLFDGMSCGQIALNRIGIKYENYFASEIDRYAINVTQCNYPNTIQLGSVIDIDVKKLPKIDLLIGGSPCQSFSFAGKQKGMVTKDNIEITTLEQYLELKDGGFGFDGQSYLFWEYIRILSEIKPKYFLLENVKMVKKWKDIITNIIGVEPICINSSLVSAQNRKRLYWTNIPNVSQPEDENLFLLDVLEFNNNDKLYDITDRYYAKKINTLSYKKSRNNLKTIYEKSKTLTAAGQNISNSSTTNVYINDQTIKKLTPIECERLQTVPDNYTDYVSNTQRYKMLGNGWTVNVIAHIFKNIGNNNE